jgi:hypothetical protein
VPAKIVVATRRAHKAARRIGLQPSFILAAIPDTVLGSEHPASALAIEHRQVAHRDAERPRLEVANAPLLDQESVANFCVGEWIDGHGGDYLVFGGPPRIA